MEEKKQKWVSEVFKSLEGSKRAQPPEDLLGKLEKELFHPSTAKVLPLPQWRMAAVAAVLLLLLNVFALQQFSQATDYQGSELGQSEVVRDKLISNYKLYE